MKMPGVSKEGRNRLFNINFSSVYYWKLFFKRFLSFNLFAQSESLTIRCMSGIFLILAVACFF